MADRTPVGARPRCVAFDVDGVVIDSDAVHEHALNQALRELAGFELTHDEHLRQFKGLPTSTKLSRLVMADRLDTRTATKVLERKQQLTLPAVRDLPVDPSKRALLATLRHAGWRLCAVSNAVRHTVQVMVEQADVGSLLEFALCNEDAAPKPSPALYLLAAERFGVEPANMVVVEDGDPGIIAAVRAGCALVAVTGPGDVGPQLLPRIIEAAVRSEMKVAV